MKFLIQTIVIAIAIAAPAASFAQSNQPVTRAQVRAELVQLEQAGYRPTAGTDPDYPADIQAAEARVAAENAAASNSGYGPSTSGTSQSGTRQAVAQSPSQSLFFTGR
jgi:Domain of unknown function (DUF4148)